MTNKYDFTIFIARLQLLHDVHKQTIDQALSQSKKQVILLIGSADSPRTPKNPWTWREREEMVRACFNKADNARIVVRPIIDSLYVDSIWVQQVQTTVDSVIFDYSEKHREVIADNAIALIGCHKDRSSFYLDCFPQWKLIDTPLVEGFDSKNIRKELFETAPGTPVNLTQCPPIISTYMNNFIGTPEWDYVMNEYQFYKRHDEMWSKAPYTPTFNCADAVVFCSGHVLLIKRKNSPGLDLVAVPGGYINPEDLTPLDAAIRELIEETKLKGPNARFLKDKVFASHVFAHPDRSIRGRIFSHAFGIDLGEGALPKVKGSDDARKAFWCPLNELADMRSQMFEDHADIIQYFMSRM